ncbi:MAG: DUF1801 domain-containing protein [Dehalococcoidia bacterium]
MRSDAPTVAEYLAQLPEDRRKALKEVRAAIRAHLPPDYEEVMQFGMISYVIPLKRYPKTYNKQPLALASLASQKHYMAVYLNNVYGDPALESWFTEAYRATGKRLDMGKSCVRFRHLDDLPLAVIGEAVARTPVESLLERYEASRRE